MPQGDSPRPQLSFDVGGASPDIATVKLSGSLLLGDQLRKGDEVHVNISGPDGEVIASGYGYVAGVAFKDKRDKYGEVVQTERGHTVKLSV